MARKYKTVLADCAWLYANQGCQGTMANHYPGMKIEDICSLPVGDICDDDCVLFFWATYPMLQEALQVIKAWGFTYKSIAFQWVKINHKAGTPFFGLGYWTRGNTEPCLLATRGKPKRISAGVFQIIDEPLVLEAPLTRHSEKPAIVRDKIVELMGDLPRIELFARQKTEGWDTWGNECPCDVDLDRRPGLGKTAKRRE